MTSLNGRYCSWCFQKSTHELIEQNYIRRNIYRCNNCKNTTLECRACKNMTKGQLSSTNIQNIKNQVGAQFFDEIKSRFLSWDDEF